MKWMLGYFLLVFCAHGQGDKLDDLMRRIEDAAIKGRPRIVFVKPHDRGQLVKSESFKWRIPSLDVDLDRLWDSHDLLGIFETPLGYIGSDRPSLLFRFFLDLQTKGQSGGISMLGRPHIGNTFYLRLGEMIADFRVAFDNKKIGLDHVSLVVEVDSWSRPITRNFSIAEALVFLPSANVETFQTNEYRIINFDLIALYEINRLYKEARVVHENCEGPLANEEPSKTK